MRKPGFFSVYGVRCGASAWTIEGIFTKQGDAELYRDGLEQDRCFEAMHVMEQPMDSILDQLGHERLGVLHDLLVKFLPDCASGPKAEDIQLPLIG